MSVAMPTRERVFEFAVLDPAVDPVGEPVDPLVDWWGEIDLPGGGDHPVSVTGTGSGPDMMQPPAE